MKWSWIVSIFSGKKKIPQSFTVSKNIVAWLPWLLVLKVSDSFRGRFVAMQVADWGKGDWGRSLPQGMLPKQKKTHVLPSWNCSQPSFHIFPPRKYVIIARIHKMTHILNIGWWFHFLKFHPYLGKLSNLTFDYIIFFKRVETTN